jgi:D-alanine-D-alanine ligase
MKKKNIAVIAGGFSGEAEVSRKGAKVVEKNLDRNQYNVYVIYIYKDKWYYKSDNQKEIFIDKNDFSLNLKGKKIKFDCIFNVIHGTPGEDGKLQGYFDMLGIPYTNSNQEASAITFDKYTTGLYAEYHGIRVPKALLLRSPHSAVQSPYKIYKKALKELGLPLIVKPCNGGSSIGMSKVEKIKELKKAIEKAFKEDEEVLVQEFIEGIEVTCGMIRKNEKIIALPLTEVVPKNSFFDYEAKYKNGKSEEITPARVSKNVEDECKRVSIMLYTRLKCKGMVRMDYIVNEQLTMSNEQLNKNKFELYLLDINTVPGLSEASIVPKQAKVAGISLSELYNIVINEALNK